jgi:ElaB/YqjD/DUF883 family membrane-anchored ribosome-binding protein
MADTTYKSTARDAARDLSSAASSAADDAANMASDFAENVSDVASRASKQATALGNRAMDQFQATADYFREHDVKEIANDLKGWVKENPTQALIAAAAFGFLTAALLKRR